MSVRRLRKSEREVALLTYYYAICCGRVFTYLKPISRYPSTNSDFAHVPKAKLVYRVTEYQL